MHQFFNVALDLLCIASTDGMFKKVNPAFMRTLGYEEAELLNRPFIEFVHEEDIESTLKEVERLKSGALTCNFQNRYRCKNGSYRTLNWMTKPDPLTGLLYAAAHDVTEIRHKEHELRQMTDAINKSAIVAVTDAKGIITRVNENFQSVSEFSEIELIGQTHRIVNSGAHSASFFADLWKTISSGKVWSGEIQNKTKSGRNYTVQTVISPLFDNEGRVISYLSIRFDVTKIKESERILAAAQRVAKIGSWSIDLEKDQVTCSQQMYDFFPAGINSALPKPAKTSPSSWKPKN